MSHIHKPDQKHLEEIWEQVPPDYYQNGVSTNRLQRYWHLNKLKEVSAAIKKVNKNPKNILDVGAASGWFLSELSKKFPKAKCTGVDVYNDSIKYGQKKYKSIELTVADAHKLPFDKDYFDIVVCCEVLEHVVNADQVLKEIRRVTKPNGYVIVEIDSGNFLFKIAWYWWTNLRKGVWRDSHLHPFNVNILEDLFVKNDFKIVRRKIFNLSMAVVFTLSPNKK